MFRETLREIQEKTEGVLGVAIMGADGIPVEQIWQPEGAELNLDVAVAEFTTLLKNARRASEDLGLSRLREMSVFCDNAYFVMRVINENYFIVLAIDPEGNFGRGRYELRRAEIILEREFAV
jgi:predicted regulator of Ras-like GTPase activity (Roadblock/LC7/MglB family)